MARLRGKRHKNLRCSRWIAAGPLGLIARLGPTIGINLIDAYDQKEQTFRLDKRHRTAQKDGRRCLMKLHIALFIVATLLGSAHAGAVINQCHKSACPPLPKPAKEPPTIKPTPRKG